MGSDSVNVSVIIPCYNAERWIERAVESVLTQEGVLVEVILVDDGSTDNSLNAIRRFEGQIQIQTGPNRGGCAARNAGLSQARGAFVMFLDADDYLEDGALRGMVDAIMANDANLCFCDVVDDGEMRSRHLRARPDIHSWRSVIVDWLAGRFVPPCGVLWSTTFARQLGGWNEALRNNQDGDFILRAAVAQARFVYAETGLAVYWHHDSEDRISNRLSVEKLEDSFSVFERTVDSLRGAALLDEALQSGISKGLHYLERSACRKGLCHKRLAIRDYRLANGWPRFEGTLSHRITSSLFGLCAKERLVQMVRNAFSLQSAIRFRGPQG